MGNETQVMERTARIGSMGSIDEAFACLSHELGKPVVREDMNIALHMVKNIKMDAYERAYAGEVAEECFKATVYCRNPQYDPR